MNLFKLEKSEILRVMFRTENFNLAVFLTVLFGLFATAGAFWVATMVHLNVEELTRSAILGFCVCLFGSFCIAWFWANVFPNMQHDRKKIKEVENKDWIEYLALLYFEADCSTNKSIGMWVVASKLFDHKLIFQQQAHTDDEIRGIVKYLQDKGFLHSSGDIVEERTPDLWILKRGIRKVKKMLNKYLAFEFKRGVSIGDKKRSELLISILSSYPLYAVNWLNKHAKPKETDT